jgi:anti-sigma B factor antagonist
MPTPLKIESRKTDTNGAVLSLQGEIDVANSHEVRDAALALLGGGTRCLVVDLTKTEYLDSAGLGILVGLLKRVKEADLKLVLAGAQPQVKRLFEITRLNQVFPMAEDVASALQEVAG